MGAFIDMSGEVYGRLTVVKPYDKTKDGKIRWLCQCECGNTALVTRRELKCGKTRSCGCYKREKMTKHGMFNTRLYRIYIGMKARCYNINATGYKNYGGRGIKICSEWNNFENFYKWAMENGYSDNLTIDRLDVNGNYDPSNCRWATVKEQANNTRRNTMITIKGVTKSLSEWCEEKRTNYGRAEYRLKAGYPIKKVFSKKGYRNKDEKGRFCSNQ